MNTTMTANEIGTVIRSAFPFSVDPYRLYGPDNIQTDHFGLFRSDTMECVGKPVKKGYVPHSIDDVCALAEAASAAFDGATQVKAYWRDGHFVTISPSKEWQRETYFARHGSGMNRQSDVYFPKLIIRASYDGRAFVADLGIHRLICANLMTIPVHGQSISANIRHSNSLRDRMSDLIENMRSVVNHTDNIADAINAANERRVNLADFIREVYPLASDASDNMRGRSERRAEAIVRRVMSESQQLGQPIEDPRQVSAWMAFNGIQGYVQHDASRKNNPSEFDRMASALEDKAVARAAELAFS